jgi:hypothetical protein
VDAIDLAYSKDHIDTFVIVSGDSDFSPLVSKLKELGKHVIGLGLAAATSDLLRDNCDEFIYYEDLDRAPPMPVGQDLQVPEQKRKVFALLMESLLALRRENKEVIGASMVKDTMKRKKPSFNEGYHGYATFSELLEDAQKHGLLDLEKHKNSGTYVVTRFGTEPRSSAPAATRAARPKAEAGERDRDRDGDRGGKRRRRNGNRREDDTARAKPAAPAAKENGDEADDDRALGRALIEDFEPVDEVEADDVPSYQPRKKAVPRPAAAKPPPPPRPQPSAPPRRKADAPPARGRAGDRTAKPKPAAAPKPAPAEDESSFGAGLDL